MKRSAAGIVAVIVLAAGGGRADEAAEKIAAQKKAAAENWQKVAGGEPAIHETAHFLIVAPKAHEAKLKEIGLLVEKHYDTAAAALAVPKDAEWPGRMAVYLFDQPGQLDAFIRRVEKRRPDGEEHGTFQAENDKFHAAAGVSRARDDPAVEVQAAQQVASALLTRRAGLQTPVPYWLVSGFGRATHYRVAVGSRPVLAERQSAAQLAVKNARSASDVWGGVVRGQEADVLAASLADFFAYGPGKTRFPAILDGFKPEENVERKTTDQAPQSAGVTTDLINARWKAWVVSPR